MTYTTPPIWPDRIRLRDSGVNADEGQRILTTATGHGYPTQIYVREDMVPHHPLYQEPVEKEPDANGMTAFDRWCYRAPVPVAVMSPLDCPLITYGLYSICGKDSRKFDDLTELLRAAFEAGRTSR